MRRPGLQLMFQFASKVFSCAEVTTEHVSSAPESNVSLLLFSVILGLRPAAWPFHEAPDAQFVC